MPSGRYKTADRTKDNKTYTNDRGTKSAPLEPHDFLLEVIDPEWGRCASDGYNKNDNDKKSSGGNMSGSGRGHLGRRLVPFRIFEIKMAGTRARGASALHGPKVWNLFGLFNSFFTKRNEINGAIYIRISYASDTRRISYENSAT